MFTAGLFTIAKKKKKKIRHLSVPQGRRGRLGYIYHTGIVSSSFKEQGRAKGSKKIAKKSEIAWSNLYKKEQKGCIHTCDTYVGKFWKDT